VPAEDIFPQAAFQHPPGLGAEMAIAAGCRAQSAYLQPCDNKKNRTTLKGSPAPVVPATRLLQ